MRRDLAVAQIEMGDVLFAQDNVVDALNAYPAALELSDRFADANP